MEIYINKEIQGCIDKLVDLFCLQDNIPTVSLRPNKHNMSGSCSYATPEKNSCVIIGCRDGLRLTTLVHEFLHAAGYVHTSDINGYSDFNHFHDDSKYRYTLSGNRRKTDTYTPLIVQDLTGKKELIL